MSQLFPIKIQEISVDNIEKAGVKLFIARADHIHELASGNKIYKLKPILDYAKTNNYKQILSFGGAYSNHLHALALMTEQENIESIALIRGEPEYAQNPTLSDAQKAGMQFEFINRNEYKQRTDPAYLQGLKRKYPNALIIPEGGSSQLAIQGCASMARDINQRISSDFLAISAGTGATAAGLACGLAQDQQLAIYSVLKDESLRARIDDFIYTETGSQRQNYSLFNADFGGYAKFDASLLDFILRFLDQTGILLDPIYTSKMCQKVLLQIEAGYFPPKTSITLIHSGGLQGWRGMQQRVERMAGEKTWNKISEHLHNTA